MNWVETAHCLYIEYCRAVWVLGGNDRASETYKDYRQILNMLTEVEHEEVCTLDRLYLSAVEAEVRRAGINALTLGL